MQNYWSVAPPSAGCMLAADSESKKRERALVKPGSQVNGGCKFLVKSSPIVCLLGIICFNWLYSFYPFWYEVILWIHFNLSSFIEVLFICTSNYFQKKKIEDAYSKRYTCKLNLVHGNNLRKNLLSQFLKAWYKKFNCVLVW